MDGHATDVNDQWAVFGVRPQQSTNDNELWSIDRAHGNSVRKILDLNSAARTGGRTLQDWVLLGTNLYYTVSDTYRGSIIRLYRYDLSSGARTQLATGKGLAVHATDPFGSGWTYDDGVTQKLDDSQQQKVDHDCQLASFKLG